MIMGLTFGALHLAYAAFVLSSARRTRT
jgi:hypothetical protein